LAARLSLQLKTRHRVIERDRQLRQFMARTIDLPGTGRRLRRQVANIDDIAINFLATWACSSAALAMTRFRW
jgi:hypothetical protein